MIEQLEQILNNAIDKIQNNPYNCDALYDILFCIFNNLNILQSQDEEINKLLESKIKTILDIYQNSQQQQRNFNSNNQQQQRGTCGFSCQEEKQFDQQKNLCYNNNQRQENDMLHINPDALRKIYSMNLEQISFFRKKLN